MSDPNLLEKQILETEHMIEFLSDQFKELNQHRIRIQRTTLAYYEKLPAAAETLLGDLAVELASLHARRNVLLGSRPKNYG